MILVAGIGNIFLGDDGFGSEAARQAALRLHSPEVRIVDFGIRGLDLAYELMHGYSTIIILDAVQRGGAPGTVYVIEPDTDRIADIPTLVDAHSMDPVRVLALARSLGAKLGVVRIVGCEPETFGPPNEGCLGLSSSVAQAVQRAVDVVQNLINEHRLAARGSCSKAES
jgi:hydrogenase maturation protease